MNDLTQKELDEALFQLTSLLNKLKKVVLKLEVGKAQHTLASRRIKALEISIALIQEKHL